MAKVDGRLSFRRVKSRQNHEGIKQKSNPSGLRLKGFKEEGRNSVISWPVRGKQSVSNHRHA